MVNCMGTEIFYLLNDACLHFHILIRLQKYCVYRTVDNIISNLKNSVYVGFHF